ncbi:hypothetical protein CFH99_06585 [Nocardioides aromaticivorans]|uniref:Uncharacterized protein n=1 Tax=Nocardioides aromaticivorans TaxID=200618 RepID=A0ABX7PHB5_9ACTN|nr:hypothetical protein [Nocardioides aromaticivorans]QSR25289.1 hypothetical protein CFH99_06585 [Nocardioides aromaticivorans]
MSFAPPPPPAPYPGAPHPATPTPSGAPAVPGAVAMLLLAIVLAVDFVTAVVPYWAGRDGLPLSDRATLALSVVPFLLYAGALAVIGRDGLRRGLAAGLALFLVPLHLAFWFVIRHEIRTSYAPDEFRVLVTAQGVLIGTALVAAWCIARRTSAWWLPALALAPILVIAQSFGADDVGRRIGELAGDLAPGAGSAFVLTGALWWVWTTTPLLLTGLACWLLDAVLRRR